MPRLEPRRSFKRAGSIMSPRNAVSSRRYSGTNVFSFGALSIKRDIGPLKCVAISKTSLTTNMLKHASTGGLNALRPPMSNRADNWTQCAPAQANTIVKLMFLKTRPSPAHQWNGHGPNLSNPETVSIWTVHRALVRPPHSCCTLATPPFSIGCDHFSSAPCARPQRSV